MLKKINNALISVSDKSDLEKILLCLKKCKINIISSGGTYKEIIKYKTNLIIHKIMVKQKMELMVK